MTACQDARTAPGCPRRDRGEAHHPVRAEGADRVNVRRGDQLADLRPGRPHEPAHPPGVLVPRGALRIRGDLRPRGHRITQPRPGLAPDAEQLAAHVRVADPGRGVGVPGKRRPARAPPRLILRRVRAGRRVVGLLRLPGDDPVLDVHLPRARPRAVHPVRRPHHLVVPPPLTVELLRAPAALAVYLTEIARRLARHEELRPPQQPLHRLAARQQRRQQLPVIPACGIAGRPLGPARLPRVRFGHLTTSPNRRSAPAPRD